MRGGSGSSEHVTKGTGAVPALLESDTKDVLFGDGARTQSMKHSADRSDAASRRFGPLFFRWNGFARLRQENSGVCG